MRDHEAQLSTDHLLGSLDRSSARGGVMTFSAQAGKVVLQLVTVVVLARLLPPSAFGLIAMVAAINSVFDLVKEFGLSAATIRVPRITHDEVTGLFWINTAAGIMIAAVLIAVAPAIADFYGQPSLTSVTRCLALGFILSGLSVQHWALMRRQMRFGVVVAIDFASESTGFLLALTLALLHAGYWALVAQRLAVPAVGFVACWSFCPWRPGLPRRISTIGALVSFGASVTGVNVAATLTRSLDQTLIGWLWGAGALGFYERASRLLMTPTTNIIVPLYSVVMPLLSRLDRDSERYRRVFCKIIEMLAMVVMPGAALAAVTADWVVAFLFGPQWRAAEPLVMWFAIAAAYQPVAQMMGLLYLTQGRGPDMLRAAVVDAALCIAAILAALRFGPVAVAASLAVAGWTLRFPVAIYLSTRRGPVSAADATGAVIPAVAGALVVAVTVLLARRVMSPMTIPADLSLAIAALVALASALATLSILPKSRRTLRDLARLPQLLRGSKSGFVA
jgi:polysaccharide transporter, PST family